MVANILTTDTPSTQGWGQKVNLYIFLKVVMLHIKLKLTLVANILPSDRPSTQGCGQKVQTISFSESNYVAYQIKANLAQSTMKANMLLLHTPTTSGSGSKGHFFFSKSSHVAYRIKAEV